MLSLPFKLADRKSNFSPHEHEDTHAADRTHSDLLVSHFMSGAFTGLELGVPG